jgi:hippurate hydrolase
MLEKRPGAMILIGNGDSAYLHHPAYDFDDRAIAHGVRYWLSLVGQELGGR